MIAIELDAVVLVPGAAVSGRYTVDAEVTRAEVSLIWHTEGKGTEHREVLELLEHTGADLEVSGAHRAGRFSMTLPAAPASYAGTFLQIRWLVRVRTWDTANVTESHDAPFVVGAVAPPAEWKQA